MHYLLLGEDGLAKDQKISEIKNKILTSEDAVKFDYEVLHSPKLNPAEFKKTLLTLPALSAQRVVVMRAIDKLDPQNKILILDFLKSEPAYLVLILVCDEPQLPTAFMQSLTPFVRISNFHKGVKQNVFDMTNEISRRNPQGALSILAILLENGAHPLQIMGGLVWFWGKLRQQLAGARFKEGLNILQEADLNIKRSRLLPEYTLEVLVVKLSALVWSPTGGILPEGHSSTD